MANAGDAAVTTPSREEASSPPPLRLGIQLDAFVQPRWIHRMIERLTALPECEVSFVFAAGEPGEGGGLVRRIAREPRHALLTLFAALDDRAFRRPGDSLDPCDVRSLFGGDLLASSARDEASIDVLLNLGRAAPVTRARHGVWTLRFGPFASHDVERVGLFEVLGGQSVTVTELRSSEERVIARAVSRTDVRSPRRGRDLLLAKSASLVLRGLRDLHDRLAVATAPETAPVAPSPATEQGAPRPDNTEMALLLLDHGLRYARERLERRLYREQWVLAYRLAAQPTATSPFRYLLPPPDRFWADPFAACRLQRRFIFFEEAPLATGRGHVSVMELRADGAPGDVVPVLERPYHLSYPFLFRHDGDDFMVPETSERNVIQVFRARGFPHHWELVEEMLPGLCAADVTLRKVGDRWWLFADVAVDGTRAHNEELHLFHAPAPFGPWTAHRRNPIFSDARRSRPAGALFEHAGALFRPAQDSSVRYGWAISFNRIERLTPTEYEEVECGRMMPDWDPRLIATHTFNRDGDLTVIDAVMRQVGRSKRVSVAEREMPWRPVVE